MKRVLVVGMVVGLWGACGDVPLEVAAPSPSVVDVPLVDLPIGDAMVLTTPPPVRELESIDEVTEQPRTTVSLAYTIDDPAGHGFLEAVNAERAATGLSPLVTYWDLEDDAHAQTERMIDRGSIYHNPDLALAVGPVWSRLGENVGVGGNVETLHRAFMNSPGHKANVLGDYTHVGIGAQRDDGQVLWVTFVFMKTTVTGIENSYGPFTDDDFNQHEYGISRIAAEGITVGCDSTGRRFCPDATVTRGQMATFLSRAFGLPASTSDHFVDDDGAWFEGPANSLADSGITKGCSSDGTRFCGGADVTRGQMAAFLTRALTLPPASADYFDDDAGRFYEDAANRMYESGVTRGCGGRGYCGEDAVTRAQMATFLTRALGL